MALPTGIVTRQVTFGPAFAIADGSPLSMRVVFKPSRSMVWNALGAPGIDRELSASATIGLQGTAILPVTDQAGWLDGLGNALSVANGAQTHTYQVTVSYFAGDNTLVKFTEPRSIALPTGDLSPVDLDVLVPVSSSVGVVVAIPDLWSQQLASAQASAAAAAASVANAVVFQGAWLPGSYYPRNALVTNVGVVYLASNTVPPRSTFTASDWLALGGGGSVVDPATYLTTETGDQLTTEAGDLLLLDAA